MSQRPNILFVTTDQQRGDSWGVPGSGAHTPNMDRIANDGAYFPNAITPSPVCSPSRVSMLTGFLPLTHGVWDNGVDLDPQIGEQGFAGRLADAGYETSIVGKAHFTPRLPYEPTGGPEDRTAPQDPAWTGPYMGFGHASLTLSGDMDAPPYQPPLGGAYERWLYAQADADTIVETFTRKETTDSGAPQTWHSTVPEMWHASTWVADTAIARIEAASDARRPFAIWMSFPDPHHPFDCPKPWSQLHEADTISLPPHRELDLDRRPWWHRSSLEAHPRSGTSWASELRSTFTRVPTPSDDQLRDVIANYYGMISFVDHNLGRVLGCLDDRGLTSNTVVVFTSDHGDWMGDHGLLLKGPMLYDGLIRVGLAITGPGLPPGTRVDDPVSTLDLPATFLDFAGIDVPPQWHSRSLLPVVDGSERRDFARVEWDVHESRVGVPLRLRAVRTATAKLTVELDSGAGEMYDLATDPFELDNIFDDVRHRGLREDLLALVHSRQADERRPLADPIGIG